MNSGINKKMIFHFYANENFDKSGSNKVHLNCIKHYSRIFDEIKMIISVDDVTDLNLIKRVENFIIEKLCYGGDLTFAVRHNTPYYECKTFRDELLIKEQYYDGLIFFGHNKGTTNYDDSKEGLDIWLCGAYFLSFEFIKEVEDFLISQPGYFYGPYLTTVFEDSGTIFNKYHTYYAGTFFWINLIKHIKACRNSDTNYMLPLDSRGYAEEYCGNFYNFKTGLTCHGLMCLYPSNLYDKKECEAATKFLCIDDETWEKYNEFKKEMTA